MRVKNESLCTERHLTGSCTDQEVKPGHRLNSGVFVPSGVLVPLYLDLVQPGTERLAGRAGRK